LCLSNVAIPSIFKRKEATGKRPNAPDNPLPENYGIGRAGDITGLLKAWGGGDEQALHKALNRAVMRHQTAISEPFQRRDLI
jgi:hypothetical protein